MPFTATLTALERHERLMTGRETQQLLTDLLEAMGWLWVHFRALQNRRGFWQVPVEGPLGTGWPDVFAIQPFAGRALGFEVKRQTREPISEAQLAVHAQLRLAGIPVHVVRPADLRDPLDQSIVGRILRGEGLSTGKTAK